MGWVGFAPLSRNRPGVPWTPAAVLPPGAPVHPELADLSRLGRRLVRRVVASARADELPTLPGLLADHLGPDAESLPVVSESWPFYEHVNLQGALDRWLNSGGRTHRLVGISEFQHRSFTLADLTQASSFSPRVGPVSMTRVASGPGGATRPCVRCGLWLVSQDEVRLALLLREGQGHRGQSQATMEAICADPEKATAAIEEIRRLAIDHSVFRGQVLAFGTDMFGPGDAPLSFLERPQVEREALILAPGLLEVIESQIIGVARHRVRLRASGQHLKRGLLLHGPPGTGKTHTLRYLMGRLTETTVVVVSGEALQFIAQACSIARALQPSLVVVEDVDLIAEDRNAYPGHHSLLFQLLNEMDGLGEDADVAFALTTNRADLLEPALAQRPGRVDQAVELPFPDADARLRLLQLYRGNLILDVADTEPIVAGTEGVTASFLKELLRRAALVAAERDGDGGDGALTVTDDDLRSALQELSDQGQRLTRVLLGSSVSSPGSSETGRRGPPPGSTRGIRPQRL